MYIAQKTLKSMPSTTPDMNQDNDELDDSNYTPKSGATSPRLSPSITGRQSLNVSSRDENYHFDQQTTITSIVNSSEPS